VLPLRYRLFATLGWLYRMSGSLCHCPSFSVLGSTIFRIDWNLFSWRVCPCSLAHTVLLLPNVKRPRICIPLSGKHAVKFVISVFFRTRACACCCFFFASRVFPPKFFLHGFRVSSIVRDEFFFTGSSLLVLHRFSTCFQHCQSDIRFSRFLQLGFSSRSFFGLCWSLSTLATLMFFCI